MKLTHVLMLLFCMNSYHLSTAQSLFSLLSPKSTTITFENIVKDKKAHNILIYSNYYGGAGVGVGDFNNDGLEDLFFAGNLVADELYLNQGNFKFKNITTSAGIKDNGGWSSGVIVADVNNDGFLDIYVTRELYDDKSELRKNKLYLNNGNLTFTESAAAFGIDNSERTRHATFLDYDKDGWLDLLLLNQPPNPGNYSPLFGTDLKQERFSIRLYRNTGKDKFTDVTQQANLLKVGYPNSVSASDFNNDGWTDLYIANDYDAADCFFINNQDGTFQERLPSAMQHTSFYSMGVDVADINNDGWLDVMVLDMVAEDNFRLKSNMSGMNPASFWKVVENGGHYQYMFNSLQLNQGTNDRLPVFSEIAQLSGVEATDWSWANLFADFDNDGRKDLYITNGLMRDIRNTDSEKDFAKYVNKIIQEYIAAHPNAGEISIWDILDVDKALKQIPSEKLSNYVYQNQGNLTFSPKMSAWGLDQKTFSNGAAYADLDNDGDLDLIVNNINDPAYIYRNNAEKRGNNYLRIKLESKEALFGSRVEVKYQDNYQLHELTNVRGMYSTSEQTVHFGLEKASSVEEVLITWSNGKQTRLEHIEANQVVNINYSTAKKRGNRSSTASPILESVTVDGLDFTHKENEFNDYEKQVLLPHKLSQSGPALATGDVNGDGLIDVFVGGAANQTAQLFLQEKDKTFHAVNIAAQDAAYEDVDAQFFDADADDDLDLYVVSGGNAHPQQSKMYQDRLYYNDGNGNFQQQEGSLPKFRDSGSCVRPFDYDGDGDLDLFVGGRHTPWDWPAPAISRILINDKGSFKDGTREFGRDLVYLGLVTDATWMDFDEDGQTDLIVVGEWMPITFLKNNNGKLEKVNAPDLANTTGWWYSIEQADMDGDGDSDLLVGNLGLNYKYQASPDAPFEVHYDDFDENGSKDIVLSYYNFGKQYPLRGRSCSSEQIPVLKEKFPTYNLFATATLDEAYNPTQLSTALNYTATTFASSYIENQGNGNWKVSALPNLAQLGSTNDFIIQDFDKDGHLDFLAAGGLYTSEVETARNDGNIGVLIKGDGKGNFQALSATESGVYLPFDVKQLKKVEIDGQDHVLVGVNNSKLRLLKPSN